MTEEKPKKIITIKTGDMINEQYKVNNCLGQGGFGAVFDVIDTQTNELYALKIELLRSDRDPDDNGFDLEISALLKLQHSSHIPRYIEHGQHGKCNYLVMQLLGKNLSELRRSCANRRLSLNTTIRICLQCLECIEVIHAADMLHRDIKGGNFAIGAKIVDCKNVYLLDFGLVRKFRSKSGELRTPRPSAGFRGTLKYASINAHKNIDLGRQDDLWSWFYMMIEFLKGELPWRFESERKKVGEMKENAKDVLLHDTQPEFSQIYESLTQLTYSDEPHYHWYKQLLNDIMQRKRFTIDEPLDWELNSEVSATLHSKVFVSNITSAELKSKVKKKFKKKKKKTKKKSIKSSIFSRALSIFSSNKS